MKRRICEPLGELLGQRGFRAAADDRYGWVREPAPGVLQVVALSSLEKYAEIELRAQVGVGVQLVDYCRLWSDTFRVVDPDERYTETATAIGRPLRVLMGGDPRSGWTFLRHEVDPKVIEDLRSALTRYGLPYLEQYPSPEAVEAELTAQHASAKPTYAGELRFACLEFTRGRKAAALTRAQAALSALNPAQRGQLSERQRLMGRTLIERIQSG
jgi:hypothetical protein